MQIYYTQNQLVSFMEQEMMTISKHLDPCSALLRMFPTTFGIYPIHHNINRRVYVEYYRVRVPFERQTKQKTLVALHFGSKLLY